MSACHSTLPSGARGVYTDGLFAEDMAISDSDDKMAGQADEEYDDDTKAVITGVTDTEIANPEYAVKRQNLLKLLGDLHGTGCAMRRSCGVLLPHGAQRAECACVATDRCSRITKRRKKFAY